MYDVERTVNYILNTSFKGLPIPREDLFQAGYLGYLVAAQKHTGDEEMSMGYAMLYMRREIKREINNHLKNMGQYQYDDLKMPVEDTEDSYRLYEMICYNLDALTDIQRDIVYSVYLSDNPKTLQELADESGVSRQRISQIKQDAIKKLRKICNE